MFKIIVHDGTQAAGSFIVLLSAWIVGEGGMSEIEEVLKGESVHLPGGADLNRNKHHQTLFPWHDNGKYQDSSIILHTLIIIHKLSEDRLYQSAIEQLCTWRDLSRRFAAVTLLLRKETILVCSLTGILDWRLGEMASLGLLSPRNSLKSERIMGLSSISTAGLGPSRPILQVHWPPPSNLTPKAERSRFHRCIADTRYRTIYMRLWSVSALKAGSRRLSYE